MYIEGRMPSKMKMNMKIMEIQKGDRHEKER
jgi:hypothetical protein